VRNDITARLRPIGSSVCDDRAMPARRAVLILIAATMIACGSGSDVASPTGTPAVTPASATPSPTPSVALTTTASAVPSGLQSAFGEDLPAGDVPLTSLVPAGTEPAGSWFARTAAGDAIVVAWQAAGADPFRTDRGFAVWRHTDDPDAPWRPVFAAAYPADRHPVLGITVAIGDVTGDGSEDALVFAETGGSGACGTYVAIDAAAGTRAFTRTVCDTTIEVSSDPPGLVVTEAVYTHGDPHCCPSAMRTTVLQRDASGGWTTVSRTTAAT
jgi:hypothetical protein